MNLRRSGPNKDYFLFAIITNSFMKRYQFNILKEELNMLEIMGILVIGSVGVWLVSIAFKGIIRNIRKAFKDDI